MSEREGVVDVAKLDRDFADEVMKRRGGEELRKCFACGTCTAGCPIREVDNRYNPRRIIRMVLLGMKDEVLTSDFVYLCANCYTCQERCPQGVRISEIMRVLKNMAVEQGYVHPSFKMQIEALKKYGRLYEIEEFDNKRRERAGLPRLDTDLKPPRQILSEGDEG